MNDNVGEMPLDIFGDYVSDCLSMDFTWEYMFAPSALGYKSSCGDVAFPDQIDIGIGSWYYYSRGSKGYGGGLFSSTRGYGVGIGSINPSGGGLCLNTGDSS
jgi:hypothetical protein